MAGGASNGTAMGGKRCTPLESDLKQWRWHDNAPDDAAVHGDVPRTEFAIGSGMANPPSLVAINIERDPLSRG